MDINVSLELSWHLSNYGTPTDSLTLPLLIVLPFLTTIRPQFPCQKKMPLSSHLCFYDILTYGKRNGDNSLP